jgi:hypothetical protein
MPVAGLAFFGAATLLFFFWVYGIVSFAFDVKNKFIPGIRQYRRGRRRQNAERKKQQERDKKERELY